MTKRETGIKQAGSFKKNAGKVTPRWLKGRAKAKREAASSEALRRMMDFQRPL